MNKNLTKIFKTIISASLAFGVLTSCAGKDSKMLTVEEIKKRGNIVLGTNAAFEPFEYMLPSGEYAGFDIEISKKIAEKLGVELKIEDLTFQSLFVNLNAKKIDFIAAGLSIDEERLKEADFSDKYFNAKQIVLVLDSNNSINTMDDLKDKKLGVQSSTTGEDRASELSKNVTSFNTITQAAVDLQNEKLDALIIDFEPGRAIVNANLDSDKKIKLLDVGFAEEEYAIATNKGETELLSVINSVLKELKESGEYEVLMNKYFKD